MLLMCREWRRVTSRCRGVTRDNRSRRGAAAVGVALNTYDPSATNGGQWPPSSASLPATRARVTTHFLTILRPARSRFTKRDHVDELSTTVTAGGVAEGGPGQAPACGLRDPGRALRVGPRSPA
ncbi:unnamed protein product [Spodoptera littoralis]|uniref:Uncharacterized protein n=1 Tax=Spodoptera littoralis TaxID=7109 RepID=A0A9P0IGG0_SPOLI|nr:unnamed protein product [Spodoptera littoralis]CAH1646844.1 unnamed protein product [Spodoptera littoralis]